VAPPPPPADLRDGVAFGQWFVSHAWPVVHLICYRFRIQQNDIDDVRQNIFCIVWAWLAQERPVDNIGPWLRTITWNACIKWLTDKARRLAVERPVAELPDPADLRLEEVRQHELAVLAHEAIDGLPDSRLRMIVRLHLEEKVTWPEVASELGISEKTARNWFKKALSQIRRQVLQQAEWLEVDE
jgi:RNA polymerase sigma factor (sigma-70 family)